MDRDAVRRLWPLAATGGLLALIALAAGLGAPLPAGPARTPPPVTFPTLPTGSPQVTVSEEPFAVATAARRPAGTGDLSRLLEVIATVAVIVVLLAVTMLLLYVYLRGRFGDRPVPVEPVPEPVSPRDQVLAAMDAGLSDLDDADVDPRRAVIACWVRLEQAAAAAGTPALPADSPADLVLRLLGAHQVESATLYRLADTYRLARYATHPVDGSMREQARAALRRLRGQLAVSRSGPLEHVP